MESNTTASLSADRPSIDPKNDLFGHAPFAKSLADSIRRYSSSDGLVLALYGPWGSGKSTILNYVQHYLELPDDDQKPVIVTFNPWWFSGQENLARAFLGQLRAVLPDKFADFSKLAETLSEFSEGIGGLVELAGAATGVGTIVAQGVKLVAPKPKDVPALKKSISDILLKENKRVLVIIDDIDRLTPEEVRQLFTVIKALADFPNLIYLLAFDRVVAVDAINQQTGLPGEQFLEKIIQVPFEMPPIDRTSLRAALFKRLNEVLSNTPEGLFNQEYWTNVFFDGIDPLIEVPRDIVRFINTLSVTYPAVIGEVNPVDFIAIEALRVFLPKVYDTIRGNPDRFTGHKPNDHYGASDRNTANAFHEAWIKEVPENLQASTKALIQRIFPKTDDMGYGGEWIPIWRKSQRVCVPELFASYFRLSIPEGAVRRSEILDILDSVKTPDLFGQKLREASIVKRVDGLSKLRAILERLMDYVETEIPEDSIPKLINELLSIGDELILPSDNTGGFDLGNENRIGRVIYHLLKRVDSLKRVEYLTNGFSLGKGIVIQCYLLSVFSDEVSKYAETSNEPLVDSAGVDQLKNIWLDKVRNAQADYLLSNRQLPRILRVWRRFGAEGEVKACCTKLISSDENLIEFLSSFYTHSTGQLVGDWAVHIQPRLNPRWLDEYIDIDDVAERLEGINPSEQPFESAKEVIAQYLIEFAMLKNGKNPDGIGAFDD